MGGGQPIGGDLQKKKREQPGSKAIFHFREKVQIVFPKVISVKCL